MGHGGEGDGTLFIKSVLEHLTKKKTQCPTVLFKEVTESQIHVAPSSHRGSFSAQIAFNL